MPGKGFRGVLAFLGERSRAGFWVSTAGKQPHCSGEAQVFPDPGVEDEWLPGPLQSENWEMSFRMSLTFFVVLP